MNFAPKKKLTVGLSAVVGIYLLSLVLIVLGSSYASVPLYQLFCQSTGFGGTVQVNHN
jgi:cytochrome c oxidase assembly protein subunit 11